MWDEYYPNGSFSVPFTILAFHEQDLVCQAFQSDEEEWMNGGEQQSPAFATAFDPKAKAGQKMKVGTVSDWTEAMKYASLVADGDPSGPVRVRRERARSIRLL